MNAQQLIDKLDQQCATRAHHLAMGRKALAASYNKPILETVNRLERLGYDALDCLEAVAS